MFFAHRAYRHFGSPPIGYELLVMDAVARELRVALSQVSEGERTRLVQLMRGKSGSQPNNPDR